MKIESYNILHNSIILNFDVAFKQICYVKMEMCNQDDEPDGILECDEMEIKYSRKKNTLNLFINEMASMIIIFVSEFDNKDVSYCYYIKRKKQEVDLNLIGNSFSKLFSGIGENVEESTQEFKEESTIKLYPIKNQNIFAKIVKKVNNNGVRTSM